MIVAFAVAVAVAVAIGIAVAVAVAVAIAIAIAFTHRSFICVTKTNAVGLAFALAASRPPACLQICNNCNLQHQSQNMFHEWFHM